MWLWYFSFKEKELFLNTIYEMFHITVYTESILTMYICKLVGFLWKIDGL